MERGRGRRWLNRLARLILSNNDCDDSRRLILSNNDCDNSRGLRACSHSYQEDYEEEAQPKFAHTPPLPFAKGS